MTWNPNRKQYKYYIGIDTGVSTGLCVYCKTTGKIRHISTVKIHVAMEAVKFWITNNPGEVFIRIEDARKRNWKPWKRDAKGNIDEKAERGVRELVGSIRRDAKIWDDYLTDLKADFEMVAPKNNKTKLNSEAFKAITKYDGTTSAHSRDAAMLVYGK